MFATSLSIVLIYMVFAIWGLIALPLQFGVGVAVILYGVRTVLGELVPAFQGIAEKVVPGARRPSTSRSCSRSAPTPC